MSSNAPITLPGFTAAETVIMAAAFYHSRSADVDWDKVMFHVNSKSVRACQERIRLCKKKEIDAQALTSFSSDVKVTSTTSKAPTGGADKQSTSKVKNAPKRAIKAKTMKIKQKDDATGKEDVPIADEEVQL